MGDGLDLERGPRLTHTESPCLAELTLSCHSCLVSPCLPTFPSSPSIKRICGRLSSEYIIILIVIYTECSFVLVTVLSALPMVTHLILTTTYNIGIIISPILQMTILRYREVK